MFTLFALIVIVSAETVTIPTSKDDNDKVYQYSTVKTGECYLTSYTDKWSAKFEIEDSKLIEYTYNTLDCTGTPTEDEISEYLEGDGDLEPAYSFSYDGTTDCSYAKSDDYELLKTLVTDECITLSGESIQFKTEDEKLISKSYNGSSCEGEYTEITTSCDTCDDDDIFIYCGSAINSIMVIALAVILMLL
ncbi:hypothetical protein QTN25_005360 [Entamoeba marina]